MPTLKFKGKAAQAVLDALTAPPQFLILYRGQNGAGEALWWRPKRSGYTNDVAEAGRYNQEEADSIASIRGDDFPVSLADIGTVLKVRQVISVEDNFDALKRYKASPASGRDDLKCPACGEIGCGPGCSGGMGRTVSGGSDGPGR